MGVQNVAVSEFYFFPFLFLYILYKKKQCLTINPIQEACLIYIISFQQEPQFYRGVTAEVMYMR